MTKAFTDTQRVILSAAAARQDLRVLPTPNTLNKNAGAIGLSIRSLIANGMIAEIAAITGDVQWRSTEETGPITLLITELGLAAIGASEEERIASIGSIVVSGVATSLPRSGSKLALLVHRLSQPTGATIDELVSATGWQKHSVRGAISGALKAKFKLDVGSTTKEGCGRVYRIEGLPARQFVSAAEHARVVAQS